jgi:anti-sigma factor RsiW
MTASLPRAKSRGFVSAPAETRHAAYETLALYLLGDLSVVATAATSEHLSRCPDCQGRLPQIREVVAALRAG